MIKYASALLLLVSQIASATIITNFDTLNLVKCSFSKEHHNRIAVQGGRIATVVVPEGDISARLEDTSGQLFLQAVTPYPPVTTISIITENGDVQDIELSFQGKSSETLVLIPVQEEEVPCCQQEPSLSQGCSISQVVDGILSGNMPCGYASVLENPERRVLKKCLIAERCGKIVSDCEIVYVWRITNKSYFSKKIYREDFSFLNPSWVYIDCNRISGGEQGLAIVGVNLR